MFLAEVVVQRRQGREFSPDRGRCEATPEKGLAPGDDVGSCERAKLVELFGNAEETSDEDPDGRKREKGNGAEAEDSNIEGSDELFSIRIVREDGCGEEGFFEHDNVFYRARMGESRIGLREAGSEPVFEERSGPEIQMLENAEDVGSKLALFGIEKGTEIERMRKVAEANTFFDVSIDQVCVVVVGREVGGRELHGSIGDPSNELGVDGIEKFKGHEDFLS